MGSPSDSSILFGILQANRGQWLDDDRLRHEYKRRTGAELSAPAARSTLTMMNVAGDIRMKPVGRSKLWSWP